MNSWAKQGRLVRALSDDGEIFVMSGVRTVLPTTGALATLGDLVGAAEARAEAIVAQAHAAAASIVAAAEVAASETTAAASAAVLEVAREEVGAQFEAEMALIRRAAAEGKLVRDGIASQVASIVARAAALATRRIVGEAYLADPALTASACEDALKAASGQQVLAIRVSPGVVADVQARLVDFAGYVRPDAAVELGGCIIDLKNGTIDATLEARLSLMELALVQAGGGLDQ